MDRSFLADQDVIAASRQFVCIRLATYEDAAETRLLKNIFAPGGHLENSVFAMLAPDGTTQLVRPGRSPVWAFGGVRGPGINTQPVASIKKMAHAMRAIARQYPGSKQARSRVAPLPYLSDLRLALNVAAADRQALVVVYSRDARQRRNMEQALSPVAWSDAIVGRAQFVAANDPEHFSAVRGFQARPGFIVIQPGTFGLTGRVISSGDPETTGDQLQKFLSRALGRHQPSRLTYTQHGQAGRRAGARWQSKTPNTDRLNRGRPRRPRR
ncbi:MAG: hypothetical protein CMJ81_15535 [Planctomycetaceae bacterium]|nr:hypothetical protein [Planctomycetaceae bacterium]